MSLGEVESVGEVKWTINMEFTVTLPSIQGSSSAFKGFEDPEFQLNTLEMEPWYLRAQPCWRGVKQSQSPPPAKASRLAWEKSQEPASCFLSLSPSVSAAPKMSEHFVMG